MGHLLNNTIQDILIRRARKKGFNALWIPGTDHASIATEAKVVGKLAAQGKTKEEIGRDAFLAEAFAWKETYGDIIIGQLKRIGASADWERIRFTMDDDYYQSVITVFTRLYREGLIYQGHRMINWDPKAQTALSDEEVNYRETEQQLYYVKYKLKDREGYITIATVRPETIMGDTGICVHPSDERYADLIGEHAIIPLVNRTVLIEADEYIDPEFGTGALKVTPAHDKNDQALGLKHGFAAIDVLTNDGRISPAAEVFVGMDRFEARKAVVAELTRLGLIEKVENIVSNVGYSERTNAVVEPRISKQWFCRMESLSKPALDAVLEQKIRIVPAKYVNTYRHWMENIHDWCISRQLWWGHRIPAWYTSGGDVVVADTEASLLRQAETLLGRKVELNELRQDEDVLDTWFSSWIWPIAILNGITEPGNRDMRYYYPTSTLVTGPDILFFWVARMVMAGQRFEGHRPFDTVYFTGIIRDAEGRKMSKSLGNSPDVLALIDQYGADALRFGILRSSPAGNDLLFDEKLCEQGRNFVNKIWNALRLVDGWKERTDASKQSADDALALEWFAARLSLTLAALEDDYQDFRLSEAATRTYKLIWDDFCGSLLEMVKPSPGTPMASDTLDSVLLQFERLMSILHPMMPFITEEVWNQLRPRPAGDLCIISHWPDVQPYDEDLLMEGELFHDIISSLRTYRLTAKLGRETITYRGDAESKEMLSKWSGLIKKLTNADYDPQLQGVHSAKLQVNKTELILHHQSAIDPVAERERISKELQYAEGFLLSVDKKLSNDRFMKNASDEVIEKEQQKRLDAVQKIENLRQSLQHLG